MLHHPRVAALKMYWSYTDPPSQVIYDFFRPEILEEAQALNIPIVLHLPKMIVSSLEDLLQVTKDFPKLRIVLAHLGLSVLPVSGLQEAFIALKSCDLISMDNSLNPSREVTQIALDTVGATRILYGSDEPLNLIRFTAYAHPEKGQRIVSDYPYHWVDKDEFDEYGHLAQNAIHSHWDNLLALQQCLETLPGAQQQLAKDNIFHNNAASVYGF